MEGVFGGSDSSAAIIDTSDVLFTYIIIYQRSLHPGCARVCSFLESITHGRCSQTSPVWILPRLWGLSDLCLWANLSLCRCSLDPPPPGFITSPLSIAPVNAASKPPGLDSTPTFYT